MYCGENAAIFEAEDFHRHDIKNEEKLPMGEKYDLELSDLIVEKLISILKTQWNSI